MSRILESSTSLLLHTTLLISVYTTFKTRRFKNTFLVKWNKHTESYLKQNIKNTWKPEEIRSDVAWSKTAVEFNIREFKGGGMFWIMWYWILVILINSGYVFRYLFIHSLCQMIREFTHSITWPSSFIKISWFVFHRWCLIRHVFEGVNVMLKGSHTVIWCIYLYTLTWWMIWCCGSCGSFLLCTTSVRNTLRVCLSTAFKPRLCVKNTSVSHIISSVLTLRRHQTRVTWQ